MTDKNSHGCCPLLLQISKCREIRVFGVVVLPRKLRSRDLFDKSLIFVHQGAVALLKFFPSQNAAGKNDFFKKRKNNSFQTFQVLHFSNDGKHDPQCKQSVNSSFLNRTGEPIGSLLKKTNLEYKFKSFRCLFVVFTNQMIFVFTAMMQ